MPGDSVQNLMEYLKYAVDATPQTGIVKEHVPCTMAPREREPVLDRLDD